MARGDVMPRTPTLHPRGKPEFWLQKMKNLIHFLLRMTFAAMPVCLVLWLCGCSAVNPQLIRHQPFTFVQMCDPQIGFGGYEADLARFERAVNQVNALQPDFVVICGDLVNKPDEQSFHDFNTARARLKVPSHCAAGNHDIGNEPTPASLQLYRRAVGRDYFSFQHKGCVFMVLNTQLWKAPLAVETEGQERWIRKTLKAAAGGKRPVFIIQHYPPFVNTPEEPDAYFNIPLAKRRDLLAAFERHGVVAILAGHTHTTAFKQAGRIQVVTSETTSNNFDKRPFGFRLWHATPGGAFRHEFVPLERN